MSVGTVRVCRRPWVKSTPPGAPAPHAAIPSELVHHTPGDEGKWFAEAIALANTAPCDPKILTRAAKDFAQVNPAFATEAGLAALRWLVAGHGYDITGLDVWAAYNHTLAAAMNAGVGDAARDRIRALFDNPAARSGFAASVLGPALDLP